MQAARPPNTSSIASNPLWVFSGHDVEEAARLIKGGACDSREAVDLVRLRADLTRELSPEDVKRSRNELRKWFSDPRQVEHLATTSPIIGGWQAGGRYAQPVVIKLTNDDTANQRIFYKLNGHMISVKTDSGAVMKGYLSIKDWSLLHVADPNNPQKVTMYDSPLPKIDSLRNAIIEDHGFCA
jgi:hypothetical protein